MLDYLDKRNEDNENVIRAMIRPNHTSAYACAHAHGSACAYALTVVLYTYASAYTYYIDAYAYAPQNAISCASPV